MKVVIEGFKYYWNLFRDLTEKPLSHRTFFHCKDRSLYSWFFFKLPTIPLKFRGIRIIEILSGIWRPRSSRDLRCAHTVYSTIGRIVQYSTERTWKIHTKPKKKIWDFPEEKQIYWIFNWQFVTIKKVTKILWNLRKDLSHGEKHSTSSIYCFVFLVFFPPFFFLKSLATLSNARVLSWRSFTSRSFICFSIFIRFSFVLIIIVAFAPTSKLVYNKCIVKHNLNYYIK